MITHTDGDTRKENFICQDCRQARSRLQFRRLQSFSRSAACRRRGGACSLWASCSSCTWPGASRRRRTGRSLVHLQAVLGAGDGALHALLPLPLPQQHETCSQNHSHNLETKTTLCTFLFQRNNSTNSDSHQCPPCVLDQDRFTTSQGKGS